MSNPQESPTPITEIVQHFTNAYYNTLYTNINELFRFYRNDAEVFLAFEDQSYKSNDIEEISNIYVKYFTGCRNVIIYNVDGQFSSGRGLLLINVHGQITLLHSEPSKFVHTFLLREEYPNTYSIQNDLFRSSGLQPSVAKEAAQNSVPSTSEVPVESATVEKVVSETVPEKVVSTKELNGSTPNPNPTPKSEEQTKIIEKESSTPQSKPSIDVKPEVKAERPIKKRPKKQEKTENAETKPVAPQQPLSYASIVGIASEKTSEEKPVDSVSSAPQKKKISQKKPEKDTKATVPNPKTETKGDKAEQKQKFEKQEKQESKSEKVNAIFINRLPPDTSDQTLIEIFDKFGKIVEINNKTKKSKEDNPQFFAFIFYEDEQSVQKALEQNEKIKLGDQYLKIEKRKNDKNRNKNGKKNKNDKDQKAKNGRRKEKKEQQKF